jgi:hypothetical protein
MKTEDRWQRTDDREQMTETGIGKWECGMRKKLKVRG